MAYIATGRTGTRSGSGTFSLHTAVGPNISNTVWYADASCAELYVYRLNNQAYPFDVKDGISIIVQSGVLGTGDISSVATLRFLGLASTHWSTGDGGNPSAVSWSYSFDCVEYTQQSGFTMSYGNWTGENGIPFVAQEFALGPKAGGSYTINVSAGGKTLTLSGTITSAMANYIIYNSSSGFSGLCGFNSTGVLTLSCGDPSGPGELFGTATATMIGAIDGTYLGGYTQFYNGGSGPHTQNTHGSVNAGYNITVTSLTGYGPNIGSTPNNGSTSSGVFGSTGGDFGPGSMWINQYYPTQYKVSGKAVTVTGADMPTKLKANVYSLLPTQWTTIVGSFFFNPNATGTFSTGAGIQASIYDTGIYSGSYGVAYVDPNNGFGCHLDQTDPVTAKEMSAFNDVLSADTRLLQRMPISPGPLLSKSARITLDPCNSVIVPGTWTNVTVVGGHLQLDTSVHANALVSYGTAIVSRQGRYLAVKVNSPVSNQPVTITVTMQKGTVTYSTVTGPSGVATDIVLDLCCCPGFPATGGDKQTSRYYHDVSTVQEGTTWGANTISGMTITFPASSGIYSIQEIALTQQNPPSLTCMTGIEAYSFDGANYYYRGIVSDVDGRRALEQVTQNVATPSTFYQVSDLISGLDSGWSGSFTPGSQWYVPNPPALGYLGGGGSTYMAGTVDNWIRRTWNQAATIPIQYMVDQVYGYPGMGDVCNGGGIDGTPYVAYYYKILRGTFNGIVANSTPIPVVGASVTGFYGSAIIGAAVTDSIGRFSLGNPSSPPLGSDGFLGGGDTVSTQAATVTDPILIREDRRIGIKGATPVHAPWMMEDKLGRLHLATIVNGDVLYQRADCSTNEYGWAIGNPVTSYGDVVNVRMGIDSQLQRIWMLVTRFTGGAYNVYSLYSDSDGSDFSTGVLVASTAIATGVCGMDNSAILQTWFVYNSGTSGPGVQKGRLSPGSGQAFGSVFTFSDASNNPIQLADQGWCNVMESKDYANRLCWCPILQGQTVPTVYVSSDNGQTWS